MHMCVCVRVQRRTCVNIYINHIVLTYTSPLPLYISAYVRVCVRV